jgi:hypothetical protein
MEQIISQLVDVCDRAEVVNENLVVLEDAEVASEGYRVNRLHNPSQGGTHLVEELHLELYA